MLKPPEKKQRAPRAAVSMRGRRRRSQQGSLKPNTQRVPVANMGINVQPKDDRSSAPINAAIMPSSISNTSSAMTPSSTSSMSGVVSFDASTPSNSRSSRIQLSTPNLPLKSCKQNHSKSQAGNAYPYFEQGHRHRTATDQYTNLSPVHQQQASNSQATMTCTGASAATRRSRSGPRGVSSRVPLVNSGDGIGDRAIQQGFHQMNFAQRALDSVKSPYTSTSAVNSSRQAAALRPMTFSGSSSGLAGLPTDQPWPTTSKYWSNQRYDIDGSALNGSADPESLFLSYPSDVNGSFGSDLSDNYFEGGLGVDNRSEPFQTFLSSSEQALEAEFQRNYQTFLPSTLDTMSMASTHRDSSHTLQIGNLAALEENKVPIGQYHCHF